MHPKHLRSVLLILFAVLILIPQGSVNAATFVQDQKLTSADFTTDTPLNSVNTRFSDAVAISGNWMAVGAPGDNASQGRVWIYERVTGTWAYRTEILPPVPQAGSEFGAAVDVYEAGGLLTVIVGAPLFDAAQVDQGRAFVFADTNASPTAFSFTTVTLNAPTTELNGRFGYSVALYADVAAVGSPNNSATENGLVTIRGRNQGGSNAWGQIGTTKTGNLGDGFGTSIDVHGEYLIVGAPYGDNAVGLNTGQAYVYRQDLGGANAWGIKHTLTPSSAEAEMRFGFSVGIWDSNTGGADSASRSMVGAPMTDNGGFADVGSVHFFNDATSNFTYSHAATANNVNAHLGYSIAIEGAEAIAGRPSQTVSSQVYTGQVDTFNYNGTVWATNTINLTQTGAQTGYYYGDSVDLSGLVAVIGAPSSREDALVLPPGAVRAGIVETLEKPAVTWAKDTDSYVRAMFDQPNTATNQLFGYTVDMTDTWLAVGVTGDGQKGANSGAVYMYQNISGVWTPHSKLTALFGNAGDAFGQSVAIEGNQLIVGAPSFDGFPTTVSNSGAIYLFELSGGNWVQTLERTSPNPSADGYFGYSVDFDGDVVVVGAYRENGLKGRAYAYRDLSTFLTPLTLDIAASTMHGATGWDVSVYDPDNAIANNEVIAIGAPSEGSTAGAAYVLSGPTFSTVTSLTDPALASGRFFGHSVSIHNGKVAVGAMGAAPSGAAFVFSGSGYTTADTLTPPVSSGQFGYDVHLENNSVVVGSPATATNTGSATVFGFSAGAWTEQGPLAATGLAINDTYGSTVTQSNGLYIVGAPTHDPGITNAGAAYAFSLAPEVTVTPTTLAVDETGPTTDTFVVALNQVPATNVTIQLTFDTQVQVDAGSGFGASPQTVTLTPANALSGVTVSVRAVDDPVDEASPHTTTITTAATSSVTSRFNGLAVSDVTVDITDNDTAGVSITQSSSSTAVTEAGGTDTYTIVLDTQPTGTVNVAITFPAPEVTVNGDTDGTFNTTFTTANWNTAQTITVAAVNDRVLEGDHTATLTHAFTSADTNYQGITAEVDGTTSTNDVTVNITDNESAVLEWFPTAATAAEGATNATAVRLDITADPIGGTPTLEGTVSFQFSLASISAEAGDLGTIAFTGIMTNVSDLATDPVTIVHLNDALVEDDESYNLEVLLLGAPTGATVTVSPTPFTGTITDADAATVAISGTTSVAEDVGSTPLTVTLTTGAGNTLENAVTVAVNLTDGTATYAAGTGDFSFTGPADTVNVTFPATSVNGATQVVNANINNDVLVEGTETFTGGLGTVTGAATTTGGPATITITDNDTASISFQSTTSTVGEATTPHTVVVVLDITANGTGTPQLQSTVTVDITQTPNAATTPADYTLTTNSVLFTPGTLDNTTANVQVTIVNDGIDEADEDFSLGFGTVSGSATASGTHTVTIIDNDAAEITVTQSGGTTAVAEGGATDSYSVSVGSEPSADVNINITFDPAQVTLNGDSDGALTLTFTTINWASAQTVNVVAVDDTLIELNPHTTLITQTVSSADAIYNAMNPDDVSVTITENDAQDITFSLASSSIAETAGSHVVNARLNLLSNGTPGGTITADMTATVNVTLGTAEGADFTLDTTSVTFPSGTPHNSTLPINFTITNDMIVEGNEDFTLSFTLVTATGTVSGTHVVTITDDEAAVVSFAAIDGTVSEAAGTYVTNAVLDITGTGTGGASLESSASVVVNAADLSAVTPADYTLTTTSINFAAGSADGTLAPISSTIVNDQLVENDEPYELQLGAVTATGNVTANSSIHEVTILENDTAEIDFASSTGSIGEAAGTYTVNAVLTLTTNGTGTAGLQDEQEVIINQTGVTATNVTDYSLTTADVTFTPADGNGATRPINVSIVADAIDESDETFELDFQPNVESVPLISESAHTVTIVDDDTAGITVAQTGVTTDVVEGGATDTYTVVLNTQPTADVTINIAFDSTEVSVNGDTDGAYSLTFTTANWNTAQTVTVTAVDDTIVEGAHSTPLTQTASSGDSIYNALNPDDVTVNITDNDTAEVIFSSAGFTAAEIGVFSPGMTLKVTANGAPGGTIESAVVVDLLLTLGTAEATDVSVTVVQGTFPAGSVHDTVVLTQTVAIADDLIVERVETFDLSLSIVSGLATTTAVNNYGIDNNDTAVVSFNASTSSVAESTTPHAVVPVLTLGGSGTGTPSIEEVITVAVSETAGTATTPADYTLTTTSITFPAGSLNGATNTVSTAIVNDALIEGAHTFTLGFGAVTTDLTNVSATGTHVVTITDDDVAGVTIVQSGGTTAVTEGGATDTFTVTLNAEPTSDVTITFDVGAQVTFAPNPLVITPANWNVAQTVTVTAVDDVAIEGPHSATVGFTFTGDANFAAITPNSINVGVNITDNDVPGITVTESDGSTDVTEGGATDTYTVVLLGAPTADVTITLGTDVAQLTIPASLTFTSANYNVPQTVTVTAVDDAIYEGDHTEAITHTVTSADTNYNGFTVGDVTVNITDGVSELIVNGSFEVAGTTQRKADGWTGKKLTSKDRRLCTGVTAFDGTCVFQFSFTGPSNVSRRVMQTFTDPAWGHAGDTLVISAQVSGNKMKTGAKLILQVVYTDGTRSRVVIAIPKQTYAFTEITDTLSVTKRVKKVTVNFNIGKTGGRVWIDAVSLLHSATPLSPRVTTPDPNVLPLPVAPSDWRN